MMNEEYMKQIAEREREAKAQFTKELGDLCCKYRMRSVLSMKYSYEEGKKYETVTVDFIGGSKETIDVTCDSLSAMVRDIFKHI